MQISLFFVLFSIFFAAKSALQHIQHLFFDLLQDVFHLHHDNLHLALVALAAESIDLATHLLGNETEFFANASYCQLPIAIILPSL